MRLFFDTVLIVAVFEALLAIGVSFLTIPGEAGEQLSNLITKVPGLDVMIGLFTWIPWVVFSIAFGWRGLFGSFVGEIIALFIWIAAHESVYRQATAGPRIVKVINRTVGRWQNHAALWFTVIALPGFILVRLTQYIVYPGLIYLLRFPKYKQSEWISVSRQKFSGLVGHDLIWCLYCDWMTGLWSLGSEMLRNLESFWCPIRFYDGKKCDNCTQEFPDLNHGWVPADGNMQQVAEKLETMYGAEGVNAWFGHPVRLTVKGK